MNKSKRVLILCPYPLEAAPSQRFRFEQYLNVLRVHHCIVVVQPFLSLSTMQILYKKGYLCRKIFGTIIGFVRRFRMLASAMRYDFIFIHREAAPIGPPIIEFLLLKLGARIVYDFDDAIFLPRASEANKITLFLKCAWKVSYISARANRVSVSNPYLVNWASAKNDKVTLLPTTVDLAYYIPNDAKKSIVSRKIVVGWTGSHSTVAYLQIVQDAIVQLSKEFDFEFLVICDVDPALLWVKNYRYVPWCVESQVSDLNQIDIGLMPVPAGEWELGKVGFKAIQYSAVGAVSVVSDTGSGNEVVEHGKTGFVISNTTEAWRTSIQYFLENAHCIETMGREARIRVDRKYSVRVNTPIFLSLFDITQAPSEATS